MVETWPQLRMLQTQASWQGHLSHYDSSMMHQSAAAGQEAWGEAKKGIVWGSSSRRMMFADLCENRGLISITP